MHPPESFGWTHIGIPETDKSIFSMTHVCESQIEVTGPDETKGLYNYLFLAEELSLYTPRIVSLYSKRPFLQVLPPPK